MSTGVWLMHKIFIGRYHFADLVASTIVIRLAWTINEQRLWGIDWIIIRLFCLHCCSLSPMTDFLQTWPPKPALRVVVRAWLTAAWRYTLNRLNHVYVKCIYADIVDSTYTLYAHILHSAGHQLNNWALFLSDQGLLHRITSSHKQRTEFRGQLTRTIYNKQKSLEEGAAAGINW